MKKRRKSRSLYCVYDSKDEYICVCIGSAFEISLFLNRPTSAVYHGSKYKQILNNRYLVEKIGDMKDEDDYR